jgi:hypothetical protein
MPPHRDPHLALRKAVAGLRVAAFEFGRMKEPTLEELLLKMRCERAIKVLEKKDNG